MCEGQDELQTLADLARKRSSRVGTVSINTRCDKLALEKRNLVVSGTKMSKKLTRRTTPTESFWQIATVEKGSLDAMEPSEPA